MVAVTHEDGAEPGGVALVFGMAMVDETFVEVPVAALGERLSTLRLCEAPALEAMRRSLDRHGQMTAVVGFGSGDGIELIDGFKRMRAARALGWSTLLTKVVGVELLDAKLMLPALHEGRGLAELEEGWLVRSLHREHGLRQATIAERLGRHKSWVCRRLMLVESLDVGVQSDVRLGLLAPRAAVALGQLPRGNQAAGAAVVRRRGLTVRQTELLVTELLECQDPAVRAERLARYAEGPGAAPRPCPGPRPGVRGARGTRGARAEADALAADVATMLRLSARLSARLLAAPLRAHGEGASEVIAAGLRDLEPVVAALARSLRQVLTTGRASA